MKAQWTLHAPLNASCGMLRPQSLQTHVRRYDPVDVDEISIPSSFVATMSYTPLTQMHRVCHYSSLYSQDLWQESKHLGSR